MGWSENCVIIYTDVNNQVPTFTITETNLSNVEIKDYNVMIDCKNFFDQPIKNDKVTGKY